MHAGFHNKKGGKIGKDSEGKQVGSNKQKIWHIKPWGNYHQVSEEIAS